MTTGKYPSEDDVALHSEKIITDEFEDGKHNEKHMMEYSNESSLKGSDEEDKEKGFDVSADEKELDIAIVDDIAITEDDTSLRSVTVRSIFVGLILSVLGSSVAQLMIFKPLGIALTNTFMLIIAYFLCTFWATFLPQGNWWLNPGPFNVKEHTCIYIMISSANTSAYGTWILSAQRLFYKDSPGAAGSIFFLFATQLIGYGIAGQLRPYLVYPSNMIWPAALPAVSLLKTFNTKKDEAKWRTRFFFMVFGGIFVYEFIPQYIFPMLGGISIICLAKSDSPWVQRLFGGLGANEGMGMFSICLDWNLLYLLNPLVYPFWVQLNIYGGIALLWIIFPVLYYYDVWHAQSFPYLSNALWKLNEDGSSEIYPQNKVLNADNTLNHTMLAEVGSPYFSTTFAVNYILINFGVTASITHVILFYGKQILVSFRDLRSKIHKEEDIHMKLMREYDEVPSWWYYIVYFVGIALNIGVAYANKSQLPWWGVIFVIALSSLFSLPLNLITAVTGQGFGVNILSEMICGFILPGYPIANMYFQTIGYNTISQAGVMAKDLKIGHYIKVSPTMTFLHQILGTIVGCIFNYVVYDSIVESKREILLSPIGNQFWSGAAPQSINSAGITWGAIGPMVMFGPNTQYYVFLWAFVIGFFLPIPGYLLDKRFPKVGFSYLNIPMVLIGLCIMPGFNSSWITCSFIIVCISQGYIKRRHSAWFARHNYLISAALDSGTSLMVFFVSMALYGGVSGTSYNFPTWWGNRPDIKYMDHCCMDCTD